MPLLDPLEKLRRKAAQDALSGLGDSAMEAIIWQILRDTGQSLGSKDLDYDFLETRLVEYFGDGAKTLMEDILWYYTTRVMLRDSDTDIKIIERLRPLEKIQKFLAQNA
jgi:hypothetical protein